MIDYDKLKNWRSPPVRHSYTAKDVMLYALGVGMGQDALDRDELRYVYERDLRVLPSMAAVLASPGFWVRDNPELGIDFLRLVHGEQTITLHQPLPVAATVIGETHVTRVVDKGEGKGALVYSEKRLTDEASGVLLAATSGAVNVRLGGEALRPVFASPSVCFERREIQSELASIRSSAFSTDIGVKQTEVSSSFNLLSHFGSESKITKRSGCFAWTTDLFFVLFVA